MGGGGGEERAIGHVGRREEERRTDAVKSRGTFILPVSSAWLPVTTAKIH